MNGKIWGFFFPPNFVKASHCYANQGGVTNNYFSAVGTVMMLVSNLTSTKKKGEKTSIYSALSCREPCTCKVVLSRNKRQGPGEKSAVFTLTVKLMFRRQTQKKKITQIPKWIDGE